MKKYNEPLYMTKTDVLYRISPTEDPKVLWEHICKERRINGLELPLKSQTGTSFFITLTEQLKNTIIAIENLSTDNAFEQLSDIDKTNLIIQAQEDEAFYSSLIEGAHTTKKKTKEMINNNAPPKNKDEQMTINNYNALLYILENLHKKIDESVIMDIYEIVTKNTLEDVDEWREYRKEQNYVGSIEEVIYTPPKPEDVKQMMDDLIKFINDMDSYEFHPILKATVIHFYFVYVHPFYDGNGRTARALSYMYLLKNGYTFFKYFSISSLLKEYRGNYYKTIKLVEDYDNDLTYFASFNIEMIKKSIDKVLDDFKKEYSLSLINKKIKSLGFELNIRQKKTIDKLLKLNKPYIDIEFYIKINKVVQETARKDLESLVEGNILKKEKSGKKYIYILL